MRIVCGLALIVLAGAMLGWTPARNATPRRTANARMANKENPVSALQIVVTGGDQNKPVDNASVYVRYDEPRFLRHPRQIELDLKTDQAGIAKVKDVPRVRILIQVVKEGWKPFGEYYELDKEEEKIEIHMKPPAHWY
ncbi:MAG TPA: hypothetical protein VJN90_13440 [Candidatus Acidoferrales bacterium]|nr:hypothetical protein [Candidatus Acidoferrales bacterium]